MELQFHLFILFLSLTLTFLFLGGKVLKGARAKNSTPRLPPGPWKLPIIGNIHQLISSLPHHKLGDLANKHGPLMHLQLGEISTIVVSSQEIAREVMKTNDIIFSDRPYLLACRIMSYNSANIVFAPYGNYSRQIRKICMVELLRSQLDLSEKIFSLTYGIASRAAFGNKSKYQEAFISIVTEITKLAAGFSLADMYPSNEVLILIAGLRPKLEKLHKVNDRILEEIVKEHRERRKETDGNGRRERDQDLVDILLKLQRNGDLEFPLTDNNIKAVILDIFAAGSETSSTVVEWAMSELLKNPRLMKEAQAENCVINGYDIPAKTKVIVNAWAIQRDPRYWKEAEKFQPERFLGSSVDFRGTDFEFIPFGAGRRICPGITFALANIELPLAKLLYHFDWKLPDGMKHEDLDMTESVGVTVKRKNNLFLIPVPYQPSKTI
ncbi:hypothetical protein SLEP1_g58435 [Rubroshorea leprosula]|uniref:Cytochrome P450 n=1 Tax=Rubroshorea leprosula TaxID=152421 RepID=A0AAV5MPE5_9ROSI|nr:hypothetical protein SLEP1_g58435 [Rubroshorea leprosula]